MKLRSIVLIGLLMITPSILCAQSKSPVSSRNFENKSTTERYYDSQGYYRGYSKEYSGSNKTRYYNSTGEYKGYEVRDGDKTRVYDSVGRYKGYKTNK